MQSIDRRSAVALGLAVASAAMVKPAAAQQTGYKDATPWPGVTVRAYEGDTPSLIRQGATKSDASSGVSGGSTGLGLPPLSFLHCLVTPFDKHGRGSQQLILGPLPQARRDRDSLQNSRTAAWGAGRVASVLRRLLVARVIRRTSRGQRWPGRAWRRASRSRQVTDQHPLRVPYGRRHS